MADPVLLSTPFGSLYRGTLSATGKNWRNMRAQDHRGAKHQVQHIIYLLDPAPSIVHLVEQRCLPQHPENCWVTQWQTPEGTRHTKISFLVQEPEEALQLLREAAQTWEHTSGLTPHQTAFTCSNE